MTCIAGIAQDGKTWIGGDSAAVAGWDLTVRADAKVFRRGDMVFGFTASFRMGDILQYALVVPKQGRQTDREFLCTSFVDAVRGAFQKAGCGKAEFGVESGGDFLVGYRGGLYRVAADFQVGRSAAGYDAVGCGAALALGSLHSTRGAPRARIVKSLHAAAAHNAAVRGPFRVVSR